MKAYHILEANFTSYYGLEPAWKLGEERSMPVEYISICNTGYHYCPDLYSAIDLGWKGKNNCYVTMVDVDKLKGDKYFMKCVRRTSKGVSPRRKLLAYICFSDLIEAAIPAILKWAAKQGAPDIAILAEDYANIRAGTYPDSRLQSGSWARRLALELEKTTDNAWNRFMDLVDTLCDYGGMATDNHSNTDIVYAGVKRILKAQFNRLATFEEAK